jgi:hypothetical protein
MNAALEFHDSEVGSVSVSGGSLFVRFAAAYVHQSEGRPGVDPGGGYVQQVELFFRGAQWVGVPHLCFGRLSDGQLREGEQIKRLVPLPYESCAPVEAELVFQNGECLSVKSESASLHSMGEPRFVESYAC